MATNQQTDMKSSGILLLLTIALPVFAVYINNVILKHGTSFWLFWAIELLVYVVGVILGVLGYQGAKDGDEDQGTIFEDYGCMVITIALPFAWYAASPAMN